MRIQSQLRMPAPRSRQWLHSISVKLGAIVVVFVLVVATLVAVTVVSLRVYNGARGHVGGEGL